MRLNKSEDEVLVQALTLPQAISGRHREGGYGAYVGASVGSGNTPIPPRGSAIAPKQTTAATWRTGLDQTLFNKDLLIIKTNEAIMKQGLTPSTFDFKESNKVDPTHGWIPFVFLIAIVPVLLILMVLAGYWIFG